MLPLLSLVALAQAPLAPAHVHPAGIDLYVEIPDIGAFVDLARTAPIGRLAHDPDFLSAIAGFVRQPDLDGAALTAKLDAAAATALAQIGLPADALSGATLSISVNGLRATLPAALERAAKWTAAHELVVTWTERARNADTRPTRLADLPDAAGEAPLDPWGHALVYTLDTATQEFTLSSLGADGAPGGSGDATDVAIDTDRASALVPVISDAFGVMIALRMSSEAHIDTLQQTLLAALAGNAEIGAPGKEGERAFSVRGMPAWIDVEGTLLVLGEGNVKHGDVLARVRGDGNSGARAALTSAHARLGAPQDRVVWLGYQAASWFEMLGGFAGAFSSLGAESPLASLTDLLPATGADASAPSEHAWRTEFDGKQFRALSAEPVATRGLGALMGRTAIDGAVLQAVPAAANAFWATSIDGAAIGKQLFALLGRQTGQSGDEWVASLERTTQLRLDKAVFENLGSTAMIYAMPWKAIGLPPVVAVVPLRDPALFAASVEHLGALLPPSLVEAGAKVNTRPYREVPITTISLGSGGGPMPIPVQPALCVLDGQLLVSTSPTPLKDEIKRRKDAKGEVHAAVASAQKETTGASAASHVDYVAIASDVLAIASNAAKMFGGDNIPVDLSMLPKRELLSKYFAPTSSRTELRDGWSYTTARGSFGPETPLFLVGASGAIGELVSRKSGDAMGAGDAEEAAATEAGAAPAQPVEPEEQTTLALRQVRGALAVYKNEVGKYPAALSDLTVPSANYPRGYVSSGSLPNDGWGNGLRYELVDGGAHYRLWSVGADGIDQSGAGDDKSSPPVR